MSISNDTFRVLKYLSQFSPERVITDGRVSLNLNMNEKDFQDAKTQLNTLNLIDGSKTHLSLNARGRLKLKEMEKEEMDEILSNVHDDYEFALFNFFYKRDGSIGLKEIPKILKELVPDKKGMNDLPIINYLLKRKQYFTEKSYYYCLNDLGKSYYLSLCKKIKMENERDYHKYKDITINTSANSTANIIIASPGAIINNKSEIVDKVKTIIKTIENDNSIDSSTQQNAIGDFNQFMKEIEQGNKNPAIDNILSLGSNISSIGSLVVSLIQLLAAH